MNEEQQRKVLSAVVFPISLAVGIFAAIATVIEAAARHLCKMRRCVMGNIRRLMVCINCENTFELNGIGRCPKCGSVSVYPLSRWIKPVVCEVSDRGRIAARADMEEKEIGREVLSVQ